MIALRLYLLRHGEPELLDGFYGHEDVALSPRGQAQAAAQARALVDLPLQAIYCSDLQRTCAGAALLASTTGRPAPVAYPALREMHLGVLERVRFVDAKLHHPDLMARRYEDMLDFRMPGGGESVHDVATRVLPCVTDLIARHVRTSPEGQPPSIALVAHNTVNRILLACATGLGPTGYVRFDQSLGAINRIDLLTPWSHDAPWATARLALANWVPPSNADYPASKFTSVQ
jgi:broad specificity phosphatase PhoE